MKFWFRPRGRLAYFWKRQKGTAEQDFIAFLKFSAGGLGFVLSCLLHLDHIGNGSSR